VNEANKTNTAHPQPLQALLARPEFNLQFYDMHPTPAEVFTPDGTAIYLNKACLDFCNLTDPSKHIGIYNLLHDTACHMVFGKEKIEKMFRGEVVVWTDMPVPIESVVDRGVIDEKPFEAATMDVHSCPIWDGGKLVFVICVFSIKNVYYGHPDVVKIKEYIENHWREEFNAEAVANALHISERQLYKFFKNHTKMSPKDYYNKYKVEHLKERLADKNLSVKEAFAACGEDSRGTYAKIFKSIVGVSPKVYKDSK
jgi:AraC-like DNA-binding protein